jgi:predicted enzyme related to lactoylglutathione lyase
MSRPIKLIVYPVKDAAASKVLFGKFLGVEPYADGSYYVGFRVGEQEIGLDPNALSRGVTVPIAYVDVPDIKSSLRVLLDAGAREQQGIKEIVGGLLVATVIDADGNILGLRQSSAT